jgi:endoribonuclease LACTB2
MNIVNVGYDSSNYYVVEQNRKRILVDTGWPGTLPKLLASLRRKSLELKDLNYLFVTHFHPDHAGLVQELKDKGLKHILFEQQLAGIPLLKTYIKPDAGYVEIKVQDSIQLAISESRVWLKRNGFEGEFVCTPGHSDDSVSLVVDDGSAFTGDLMPATMVDEEKVLTVAQSWDRLRRLHVRMLYPGHGPVRPLA